MSVLIEMRGVPNLTFLDTLIEKVRCKTQHKKFKSEISSRKLDLLEMANQSNDIVLQIKFSRNAAPKSPIKFTASSANSSFRVVEAAVLRAGARSHKSNLKSNNR